MLIRIATAKDAKRISYLIHKSTDANPNNYSPAQIKAWKHYNTPSKIRAQLNNKTIFCAFSKNKLIGTIALKDNFITGFYVSYALRGKGIGRTLLQHLEHYVKRQGIPKLHLSATPSGIGFYQHQGYIPQKDIVVTIYGIDYPEVLMEKLL